MSTTDDLGPDAGRPGGTPAGPPAPPVDPAGGPAPHRSSEGRWLTALLVIALVLLVPTIGLRLLIDREPPFCENLRELPALRSSLDQDGTPGPALIRSAELLDDAAAHAPDDGTAAAARLLADHERRVGEALRGQSSSREVVDEVVALDDADPGALAAAADTLDRAIRRRCG
jgi:hypothetical protein